MMEYLTFSSPGKHSIQAVVVADPEDEEAGYVKKRVLQSDSRWGQYQHRVVNNSGELDLSQIEIHSIEDSGSIEIEISKEFFAPEPPAWLLNWVTLWWGSKIRDQCDFRRRVIFAFTIQLLLVVVWVISSYAISIVLSTVALLCGRREIGWEVAFHPYDYDPLDALPQEIFGNEGSIFFSNKKGKWRHPSLALLAPIFPVSVFLTLLGITFNAWTRWTLSYSLLELALAAVVIPLIFSIGLLVLPPILRFLGSILGITINKAIEKLEENEKRELLRIDFDAIVCDGIPTSFSIHDLPKKKRTLHLYYEDMKTRVCKPFAR